MKVTFAGRASTGPDCSSSLSISSVSTCWKSVERMPSYRYARIVKPMTMSGFANSDASEGTSLPKKGTASSRRDVGWSTAARCCATDRRP